MTTTEIRIRYLTPASAWAEGYWLADVIENGKAIFPGAYARSYKSADEAKHKLLEILDGKRCPYDGKTY